MNIVLIAVGLILVLGFIIGYKRGFIKIVASLVITLATLILVAMISPTVSKMLLKYTPIETMVEKHCTKNLPENLADELTRDEQIALIDSSQMPEIVRNLLIDNNNEEVREMLGVTSFVGYINKYLAKLVADILAFLITFIIITIIARIILCICGLLSKLPVIGGLNRLLGGVTGIAFAVLIVWILFVVITLLYQAPFASMCLADIEKSKILQWLYDKNVLMNYLIR